MEIKDLAGLSQPLTKMIETLENAGAALYEPTRIRRRAAAEGDARLTTAQAEIKALDLIGRARARVDVLEARRQKNLEAIAAMAADQLPAAAAAEPVDPDWTAEFLNSAQDVSNEEMQTLWARLLAGEVARPGRFSRRTLHSVRVLSHRDAELFTKCCSLAWTIGGRWYCIVPPGLPESALFSRLRPGNFMDLGDIGLVSGSPPIGVGVIPLSGTVSFEYLGSALEAAAQEELTVNVIPLTVVGEELAPISGPIRDEGYFTECVDYLKATFDRFEPADVMYTAGIARPAHHPDL